MWIQQLLERLSHQVSSVVVIVCMPLRPEIVILTKIMIPAPVLVSVQERSRAQMMWSIRVQRPVQAWQVVVRGKERGIACARVINALDVARIAIGATIQGQLDLGLPTDVIRLMRHRVAPLNGICVVPEA